MPAFPGLHQMAPNSKTPNYTLSDAIKKYFNVVSKQVKCHSTVNRPDKSAFALLADSDRKHRFGKGRSELSATCDNLPEHGRCFGKEEQEL
jgi:hypothetical protein